MKKIKSISILWLMVCLMVASACSDRTEPEADTAGGISVRLAVDSGSENQQSRSELTEIGAENHVSQMTIYIYKGTGDAAEYVGKEKVIGWTLGQNSLTYQLTTALVQGADYTLLGVGMDKASVNTYYVTEGQTLGNTYATLKNEKTPADMAQSEFFTGTVSFTNNGKHTVMEDLVLKRRVAGVMLYVKDIPQKLVSPADNSECQVTDVYVKLGQNQKSSVRLWRNSEDINWKEPDGQSEAQEEDSRTLLHLDLSSFIQTEGDYYEITPPAESGLLANTLLTGGYILPMNMNSENATFTVELWGEPKDEEVGSGISSSCLLKSFVVENKSESNSRSYDIRSNYLYCIGKNFAGTEDDQPVSLLGEKLQMEVLPWTEVEQKVDFQPARVQAIFNPDFDEEKYRFNCINNEFEVEILPSMNAESWEIVIPESTTVLNADGTEETSTAPWLYVKTDDTSCSLQYQAKDTEKGQATKIKFLMMDYAVQRDWGWNTSTHQWDGAFVKGKNPVDLINNDVRTIQVELRTTLASGQPRTDYLTVSQYNTITVNYQNGDGTAVCGFSRVDVGDQFNKQARDVIEPDLEYRKVNNPSQGGKTTSWGYNGGATVATSIYGGDSEWGEGRADNGAVNMKDIGAYFSLDWEDAWNGSAMQKSQCTFVSVTNGVIARVQATETKNSRTDQCWYLPAKVELEGFFKAYMGSEWKIQNNVVRGDRYWSSNINGGSAIVYSVYKNSDYVESIKVNRGQGADGTTEPYSKYYIRQARRF